MGLEQVANSTLSRPLKCEDHLDTYGAVTQKNQCCFCLYDVCGTEHLS